MADEVKLITFAGETVSPLYDGLMQELYTGGGGIITGAVVTIKDASNLHITGGYGALCGREFEIFASDIPVTLSSSGTLKGRLYLHMDLAQSGAPIELLVEVAASLTPVVQDSDVNTTNGVYEVNLATFDVGTSAISNLADVAPKLVGIESSDLTSIKAVGSTNATGSTITKGTYFYLNGKLCLAKSDIANGATFTLNTNYEVVTAGGLNSLNSAFVVNKKNFGGNANNLFIENTKRLLAFNGGVVGSNGLIGTLDATDRPSFYIYSLCVVYNSGSYYIGYLTINPTNGVVTARYFVPGTSTDAPVGSGGSIYGEASWYVANI